MVLVEVERSMPAAVVLVEVVEVVEVVGVEPDSRMVVVMALVAVELPDTIVLASVLHSVLVVLIILVKVAVEDSMSAKLLVKLETDTLLVADDKLAVA